MILTGWGRYPRVETELLTPARIDDLRSTLIHDGPLIARGNGRSYGDAAVSHGRTVSLMALRDVRAFDPATGVLVCTAGVMLDDILRLTVPLGWFPYVTPGTRFVTVGGMIASDVHGKNHHKDGSFCRYLLSMDVLLGDGTVVTCSRERNRTLFHATCGGMGLTGIILRATFRLRRIETPLIRQTIVTADNLTDTLQRLSETSDATYSVAWLDCLASGGNSGRSALFLGEHAKLDEIPAPAQHEHPGRWQLSVPFAAPDWVLTSRSVRCFNALYLARQHRRPAQSLLPIWRYFYPLDALANWNRLYGRRGLVQFQCVIPPGSAQDAITEILTHLRACRAAPFLAVLKRMGGAGDGLLSFPMEGYTLALDLPVRADTGTIFRTLEGIVTATGGRQYLSKDALMSAGAFADGYGERLRQFLTARSLIPGTDRMESALSRRLGL